jgi:hypothetical protein
LKKMILAGGALRAIIAGGDPMMGAMTADIVFGLSMAVIQFLFAKALERRRKLRPQKILPSIVLVGGRYLGFSY